MKLEPHLDPCRHCGACLSFCVWDAAEREMRPAGPDLCRDCQVCYRTCPRLLYERAELAAARFPDVQDGPWGRYRAVYTVRTAQPPPGVQDGGLTTRLGQFLLDTGRAEAILVTGRRADWLPQPYWATDGDGVARACGSKYAAAPALAVLGEGWERFRRVALIVLPCQAAALARLLGHRPEWVERIALIVGLFCTESFYQNGGGLTRLVEERLQRPVEQVERFDIKRGRFTAHAGEAVAEWRMKELHDVVWPVCLACQDLTAEFADLSVGSIGSGEGANTAIVRSQAAEEVLVSGVEKGLWTLSALENPEGLAKQCDRKRGNPEQLSPEERTLYGRATVRGNWKRRQRRVG